MGVCYLPFVSAKNQQLGGVNFHLIKPRKAVTQLPPRRMSPGREMTPTPEEYEQLCVAIQEVPR